MKKLMIVAACLTFIAAATANAQVVFNVNATSSSGGVLSGTFTTNNALSTVQSFAFNITPAGSFAGFNYTIANSVVTASTLPSQFFQIDDNTNQNELRLFFNTPLTMTGTTLNPTQSFEHEPSGGNRFFAGAITAAASTPIATAAPEPATWGMMIVGVGVAGAALRRRRQVTTRVSYAI